MLKQSIKSSGRLNIKRSLFILTAITSAALMMTACSYGTKQSLTLPPKPLSLIQPCQPLEKLTDPYSFVSNAIINFGIAGECAIEKEGLNKWVDELYD